MHGQAEDPPDQHHRHPAEPEVEQQRGRFEGQPEGKQRAQQRGEEREEGPGAVGDAARDGIHRKRLGIATGGDPLIPLGVPQPEQVADRGVQVSDASRRLEPARRDRDGAEGDNPREQIDNGQGPDGVVQGAREEGVAPGTAG